MADNLLDLVANEIDREMYDALIAIEDRDLLRKKPYNLFMIYFIVPPVCEGNPRGDHAEWSALLHEVVQVASDEFFDYLSRKNQDFTSIGFSETCGLQLDHNVSPFRQEAIIGRQLIQGERLGSFHFYGRGSAVNYTVISAPSATVDDVEISVHTEKKPKIHYMPKGLKKKL